MKTSAKVNMSSIGRMRSKLVGVDLAVQQACFDTVAKSIQNIQAGSKSRVPVQSGALLNSHHTRMDDNGFKIEGVVSVGDYSHIGNRGKATAQYAYEVHETNQRGFKYLEFAVLDEQAPYEQALRENVSNVLK